MKSISIEPVQNGYIVYIRKAEGVYGETNVFNCPRKMSDFIREYYEEEQVKRGCTDTKSTIGGFANEQV